MTRPFVSLPGVSVTMVLFVRRTVSVLVEGKDFQMGNKKTYKYRTILVTVMITPYDVTSPILIPRSRSSTLNSERSLCFNPFFKLKRNEIKEIDTFPRHYSRILINSDN